MNLYTEWHQDLAYGGEAPISKHEITNNIRIPISNDLLDIGHLVIGDYLEFGIWIFPLPRDLVQATPG